MNIIPRNELAEKFLTSPLPETVTKNFNGRTELNCYGFETDSKSRISLLFTSNEVINRFDLAIVGNGGAEKVISQVFARVA